MNKLLTTALLCACNSIAQPLFVGPCNGQADVGLTPLDYPDGPMTYGYFDIYFGDVTELIRYDPVAETLSIKGSVEVTPSMATIEIKDDDDDGVVLGTATLSVGNAGYVLMDITYTSTGGGGYVGDMLIPVSATGTYLGQPFTATWNEVLPLAISVYSSTSDTVTFKQETDWYGGLLDQSIIFGDMVVPQLGLTDGAEVQNTIWYQFNTGLVTAKQQPRRTVTRSNN